MAKRDVFDCDRCPKNNCDVHTILVYVGSKFNGVDKDHFYRKMDLCFGCCAALFLQTFDNNDADGNKILLKKLALMDCGAEV